MFDNKSDGGITMDVRSIHAPSAKLKAALKTIEDYVIAMHVASRPIEFVTISTADYSAYMDAAAKQTKLKVVGLTYEGIRVKWKGQKS